METLKTPEEYGYVVKNGFCLFQKGPLSQWYGGCQLPSPKGEGLR